MCLLTSLLNYICVHSLAVKKCFERLYDTIILMQKRFTAAERKFNDRKQDWKLDVLSALMLVESSLNGPGRKYYPSIIISYLLKGKLKTSCDFCTDVLCLLSLSAQ